MADKQQIITALQEEIAAAEKERTSLDPDKFWTTRRRLAGYIEGLQTAVNLLEKQPQELPY